MGAPISYSTFSKIYVWNLPISWNMDFLAVSKFVWYWFVAFSNTQLIIPTHCQIGLVTTATTSYKKEHDRIKFYKSFIIVICLFIVQCHAQQNNESSNLRTKSIQNNGSSNLHTKSIQNNENSNLPYYTNKKISLAVINYFHNLPKLIL